MSTRQWGFDGYYLNETGTRQWGFDGLYFLEGSTPSSTPPSSQQKPTAMRQALRSRDEHWRWRSVIGRRAFAPPVVKHRRAVLFTVT